MEDKIVKSYLFFLDKEENKIGFKIGELAKSTGWSEVTARTYLSKKWDAILEKKGDEYFVKNISKYSKEEYSKLMSQKNKNSQNPFKPELEEDVERLVIKAKESALLALDIYNRPATLFKSEGFIVLMIIAWTSLFHSIFHKKKIKFNYINADETDKHIDGEIKYWELSKCVKEFYKEDTNPIRTNIEFMIGLRNKIEHRFAPKIDNHIGGECQALLLNFDELIISEYGNYYALKDLMVFPLQTSNFRNSERTEVIKKFQGKHYDEIKEYIEKYRGNIPDDLYNNPKFSFRVFLMPKVGNHKNSSDISMEFIPYDVNTKEDRDALQKHVTIIKEKNIQVANQGKFKPSAVVDYVKEKISSPFTMNKHVKAYKYYKIRSSPSKCKVEFCQFDEPHNDYIYTQKWMDYLVEKLSDVSEYNKVIAHEE